MPFGGITVSATGNTAKGGRRRRRNNKKRNAKPKITHKELYALRLMTKASTVHRPLSKIHTLPNALTTNFVYSGSYMGIATSALSAPSQYNLLLNSMYDIDKFQAGHQAMLWDQMKALYQRYKVLKAQVEIRCVPVNASQASIGFVFWPSNDVSSGTTNDISYYNEHAKVPFKLMTTNQIVHKKTYDIAKILEIDKTEYIQDEQYYTSTATSSDPAQTAYLSMAYQSLDTANSPSFSILYRVVQTVELRDLLVQTAS